MSGTDMHGREHPAGAGASNASGDRKAHDGNGRRLGNGNVYGDDSIRFQLDGVEVEARAGETILQAARRHGGRIPHLCYTDGMREDGNCRACVVEIEGERVLAASCCRAPAEGMKVHSANERARRSQRMVLELLLADMPAEPHRPDSELDLWARELGVGAPRFPSRAQPQPDFSHPAIAVRLDACIQCTRCVRACREVQVNDVIGYAGRGANARIVFDLGDAMGASSCVGCGECVQACPTGALMPAGVGAETPVLLPHLAVAETRSSQRRGEMSHAETQRHGEAGAEASRADGTHAAGDGPDQKKFEQRPRRLRHPRASNGHRVGVPVLRRRLPAHVSREG